jgi:hypothetical protein
MELTIEYTLMREGIRIGNAEFSVEKGPPVSMGI